MNTSSLGSTDFSLYNLIIIGGDTAYSGSNWGSNNLSLIIQKANKPIIGIYRGGAVYFNNISLYIG
ncbi:MAG: hypothetical protein ACTSQO_05205 [Candidatus Helarchaeota archaeon]